MDHYESKGLVSGTGNNAIVPKEYPVLIPYEQSFWIKGSKHGLGSGTNIPFADFASDQTNAIKDVPYNIHCRVYGNALSLTEQECESLLHTGEYIPDLGYFLPVPGYWGFNYYKSARLYFDAILVANCIYQTNPIQYEWDEVCTWGYGGCTMEEYKKAGERSGNWIVLKKEVSS